jgi:hypothetical protein
MAQHTAEKSLKSMIFIVVGEIDYIHQLGQLSSMLLFSATSEQNQMLTGIRQLSYELSSLAEGNLNKKLIKRKNII